MEEVKGEVKHILLVQFKDGLSEQEIEEYMKEYANLVNLIPSMKAFRWGKEAGIEKMEEGFTHVFESTFESTQGVSEYLAHPAHIHFSAKLMPHFHKLIVFDFNPIQLLLSNSN